MDMQTAVKTVLGKYATFSGRAVRSEYWWWFLAVFILNIVVSFIDSAIFGTNTAPDTLAQAQSSPLGMLTALALLLPNLAVAVRRLHDTDRSGWWLLLGLIPLLGVLVLLFWFTQPGTAGENRFGSVPVESPAS